MRTTGLVVERLDHFYYVVVGGEYVQGLDFLQLLYFLQRIELLLHALYRHVFPALQR